MDACSRSWADLASSLHVHTSGWPPTFPVYVTRPGREDLFFSSSHKFWWNSKDLKDRGPFFLHFTAFSFTKCVIPMISSDFHEHSRVVWPKVFGSCKNCQPLYFYWFIVHDCCKGLRTLIKNTVKNELQSLKILPDFMLT